MEPRRPGSGLWIHRAPDAYLPAAARFPAPGSWHSPSLATASQAHSHPRGRKITIYGCSTRVTCTQNSRSGAVTTATLATQVPDLGRLGVRYS
jgi:hypothetical protein